MQDIDTDPNEEVADGGQHEKLLENQIVDGQHESLPHG